jgi:hypothetical protein
MLAFIIHFPTERQQNLDRCSFSSRFQVSTLLPLQQNMALAEKKQDGYLKKQQKKQQQRQRYYK